MRQTIHQYLTGLSNLTDIVPAERWWTPGRVIDRPVLPFVVLRWLAPVQGNVSTRYMRQLRVDVHDTRGSYANIEALLGSEDLSTGVYGALSGLAQHVGPDGRVTQCDYLGHSGDNESSDYNSNFMFSSWRVIGVEL
jgi:hypothetical protein